MVVILGLGLGIYRIFFIPRPLKMRKLERATTTVRTANNNGYPEKDSTWLVAVWEEASCEHTALGSIPLDNNQEWYVDEAVCDEPLPVTISLIGQMLPLDIAAGETILLTYDGGQELTVYLPAAMTGNQVNLYPASDGSTYYDKGLTKLAQKVPISSEEKRQ